MIVQLLVALSIFAIPISLLYLLILAVRHNAAKRKVLVSVAVFVLSVLCVVLYHLPKQVFPEGSTFRFIQVELGGENITLNNANEVGKLLSNVRGHRVLGSFTTDGCEGQDIRIWVDNDPHSYSWMLYAPEDGVRFLQKSGPGICIKILDDDVFYAQLLELIQQNIP